MKQVSTFEQLTIQYRTGPIPPPFCHSYQIFISTVADHSSSIELELRYEDREEISDEEIYDEGFTLDDDFSWKGKLPSVWHKAIEEKLASTQWRKRVTPNIDGSELKLKIKAGAAQELAQPADQTGWQVFSQDIIQAAFELAGKEAPLTISFLPPDDVEARGQINIEYSFAKRTVVVKCGSVKNQISWKEGHTLLKQIFSIDYYPEQGMEKLPAGKGRIINPGDGRWYDLTSKEQWTEDDLQKIEKLSNTLSALCEQ